MYIDLLSHTCKVFHQRKNCQVCYSRQNLALTCVELLGKNCSRPSSAHHSPTFAWPLDELVAWPLDELDRVILRATGTHGWTMCGTSSQCIRTQSYPASKHMVHHHIARPSRRYGCFSPPSPQDPQCCVLRMISPSDTLIHLPRAWANQVFAQT